MTFLIFLLSYYIFHVSMKKRLFVYFSLGYLNGLLLVNFSQSFPSKRFGEDIDSNKLQENLGNNYLSSTAITSFIDKYTSTQNRREILADSRERRSIDSAGLFKKFEEVPGGHKSPNKSHSDRLNETVLRNNFLSNEANEHATLNSNPLTHNTPQYMLDLFSRFENDPFSQPASNIVRSFFNSGKFTFRTGGVAGCRRGFVLHFKLGIEVMYNAIIMTSKQTFPSLFKGVATSLFEMFD